MKWLSAIERIADVLLVILIDPDRALVHAAKQWAWRRKDHCNGKCENCDALVADAWERCQRWRYAQQVKRSLSFDWVLAAAVHATARNGSDVREG
jgi:hypothetical protein